MCVPTDLVPEVLPLWQPLHADPMLGLPSIPPELRRLAVSGAEEEEEGEEAQEQAQEMEVAEEEEAAASVEPAEDSSGSEQDSFAMFETEAASASDLPLPRARHATLQLSGNKEALATSQGQQIQSKEGRLETNPSRSLSPCLACPLSPQNAAVLPAWSLSRCDTRASSATSRTVPWPASLASRSGRLSSACCAPLLPWLHGRPRCDVNCCATTRRCSCSTASSLPESKRAV